jgi:hypothetical protein
MDKTAIGADRIRTRTRRVWRGVAALTATTVLAGGAVLAVAVPSHAQNNNVLVVLENAVNHQCLQDNGFVGGTDNPVVTQPCNKSHENQVWVVSGSNLAETTVGNEATTLCLQSASRKGGPNSVHTQSCSGAADELWAGDPVSAPKDAVEITNQQTHLCLGSDASGNVYTHTCDSSHRQLWIVRFVDTFTLPSPSAGS